MFMIFVLVFGSRNFEVGRNVSCKESAVSPRTGLILFDIRLYCLIVHYYHSLANKDHHVKAIASVVAYDVLIRLILARYNSEMVLTVSMKNHCLPSSLSQSHSGDPGRSYAGCPVTLQRVKTTQFGRANQRWIYDDSTGVVVALSTDTVDKGKRS